MRRAAIASLICLALLQASAVRAQDRVVLQLRFDHQFQFAGYYAANWRGYYRDEGIDVEIRPGVRPDGSLVDVVAEMAGRRADFGIAAGEALLARSAGHPLVVVASIMQQSAVEVIANAATGVSSPADLVARRVQAGNGALLDVEFRAMLAAEGIDPARVPLVPVPARQTPFGHFERLFDGSVDATLAYSLSLLWYARERGFGYVRMRPSSYGIDFYGDSLFAHHALIERNPDLVERFRRATLRGWEDALADPDGFAERIARELPRVLPVRGGDLSAYNRFMAARMRELVIYPLVEVGHVNPLRWKAMHGHLARAGLVKGELDLDTFVFNPADSGRRRAEQALSVTTAIAAAAIATLVAGATYVGVQGWRGRRRRQAQLVALNRDLERRVAERTRALKEHIDALESFNRSVSHDLRGPMGSIAGLAPILADAIRSGRSESALQLVDAIGAGADRMIKLLEALLALAHADSRSLNVESVATVELARESAAAATGDGASVQITVDPAMPEVPGDAALLRQVFVNLLGNAVKFSAGVQGPRVEVGSVVADNTATFFVRDNGPGFDPSAAATLFKPFVRLHRHDYEGFGIGLSIVKRIVDRHQGAVWAESTPGSGATFYFRLPLTNAEEALDSGSAASRG